MAEATCNPEVYEYTRLVIENETLKKENAKLSRKLELASEFYARKNSISMFEYEKEKFKKEIEERYNFEMEDNEEDN